VGQEGGEGGGEGAGRGGEDKEGMRDEGGGGERDR